ncbi:anthrone oxygenase family protein [Williamsia sp. SKLECPSW1]
MTITRPFLLVASVLCSGLVAGLFAAFSYSVMPGLHRADDRTFVVAMQRINVAILNPVFLVLFFGGSVLALAAWWTLRADRLGPWALAAAVLYLIGVIVTVALNVPLNDRLASAGLDDPASARRAFESSWVAWNLVRTALHTAAFAVVVLGLVVTREG